MFDVVLVANTIKDMSPEAVGGAASIPGLLGERCAVVSQDGMDLVRKGFNHLA